MDRTICRFCKRKFTAVSNCCRHEKHRCHLNPNRIVNSFKCEYCSKPYSTIDSCSKHEQLCSSKPVKRAITIKPKVKAKLKVKVKVKVKDKAYNTGNTNPDLHQLVSTKKIYYISDNILDKFQDDLGYEGGIDFLLTNFMKHKFNHIIDKAYLEGLTSDDYPMACKGNGYFRFVDGHGNLVDDATGILLIKAIINNIQNSILRVSNILIRRYSGTEQMNSLYDAYDLGTIQKNICDMMSDKVEKHLKKYLVKRVINPNHLFFKDERFMEIKNAIFNQFNKQSGNIIVS